MSHFTVMITLPAGTDPATIEAEIGKRMARWDEGREVAPWRNYKEGDPESYWAVNAIRRYAREHRESAPIEIPKRDSIMDKGDGKIYVSGMGYVTELEYIARKTQERAEAAVRDERLGEHPTWETVVEVYNDWFHPATQLAVPDEQDEPGDDSERLLYDPESGRAYMLTTSNPEGLWDYWRIGGRWGGYFRLKADAPGVIKGARGWDSPGARFNAGRDEKGLRADGGMRGIIDLAAMRADAAEVAHAEYDAWEALVTPDLPADVIAKTKPWSHYAGLAKLDEITWDEARSRYSSQLAIKAARQAGVADPWGGCVIEKFLPPREEYVANAVAAAVPAYALVTLDGEWIAPGRMGWFGMSSDGPGEQAGYHAVVNRYIEEQLTDQDILVVLDCHV